MINYFWRTEIFRSEGTNDNFIDHCPNHELRTPKESFLSLCILCITKPFFLQNAMVFIHFLFGIGIYICAVENLESSHHVSVVRVLLYLVLVGNEYDTP